MPRERHDASDGDLPLWCDGQIDARCFCEPGAEAVRRRTGVHETQLRRLLEIFDLHRNDRPRERRRTLAGELDELKPHAGAAPSASATVVGTLNIPYPARR